MSHKDIVFLDDKPERHKSFTNSAPVDGFRVWHPYTAEQAIECIERHRPVQVFLDHDLSDEDVECVVGQPTHAPTGMAVVEHIMGMADPPLDVVVHSCNGPASELMVKRLKEHPAGIRVRRIAFPYLIHVLNEAKKRSSE